MAVEKSCGLTSPTGLLNVHHTGGTAGWRFTVTSSTEGMRHYCVLLGKKSLHLAPGARLPMPPMPYRLKGVPALQMQRQAGQPPAAIVALVGAFVAVEDVAGDAVVGAFVAIAVLVEASQTSGPRRAEFRLVCCREEDWC